MTDLVQIGRTRSLIWGRYITVENSMFISCAETKLVHVGHCSTTGARVWDWVRIMDSLRPM